MSNAQYLLTLLYCIATSVTDRTLLYAYVKSANQIARMVVRILPHGPPHTNHSTPHGPANRGTEHGIFE